MIEIFHVSDLHFEKSKKRTAEAQLLLSKIKRKFGIEQDGDRYLLITGDITQHGWKLQNKKALDALVPFKKKVRVVPGNHDYGFQGFVYARKCARYFEGELAGKLGMDHPFISKMPYSEMIEDGEENKVLLIGINSCLMTRSIWDIAKGDIGEKQRNSLDKILKKKANKDIPKIVFLHHIPHRRARGIGMSLKDYKKFMTVVRNKVDALIFGHEGAMSNPKLDVRKKTPVLVRELKLRSGKGQGIRYYLDANQSVKEQSCYRIRIEGKEVSARRFRL